MKSKVSCLINMTQIVFLSVLYNNIYFIGIFINTICIKSYLVYNNVNFGIDFRRVKMKTSNGKQLAKKMLIAMICGLACGFGCIMLREHLVSGGQTDLWTKINNLF